MVAKKKCDYIVCKDGTYPKTRPTSDRNVFPNFMIQVTELKTDI